MLKKCIDEADYLIIGAGIVGLAIARALVQSGVDRITVIEKEAELGLHASGRNSGVLHAAIYYPPNTLKAELCLKGNLLLQDYCKKYQLPLIHSGKVIVARDETEVETLKQLYERAQKNGAKVELIDEKQLIEIEPNAKTCGTALYSHYTALVDNKAILKAIYHELLATNKVKFLFSTAFKKVANESEILTSHGKIRYQRLINAAGSYADKVAHAFDVGKEYFLVPFKGIYQKLIPSQKHLVNGNIYPVPNLGNPFLGVHFTKNISGDVYVGPTAIPAFGRENYGLFKGIDGDIFRILKSEIKLFLTNAEFRKVALEEPKKYSSKYFYEDAKRLVKELKPEWLTKTTKVGIRPQLISTKENKLMMDFMVVKEKQTVHILNAISPAFTSSFAFADYVLKHYLQ